MKSSINSATYLISIISLLFFILVDLYGIQSLHLINTNFDNRHPVNISDEQVRYIVDVVTTRELNKSDKNEYYQHITDIKKAYIEVSSGLYWHLYLSVRNTTCPRRLYVQQQRIEASLNRLDMSKICATEGESSECKILLFNKPDSKCTYIIKTMQCTM
jgi:hypothetical protein